MKQFWHISVKWAYLGKCYATREEIVKACGPYCEVYGTRINIWGKPLEASTER